MLADRFRAGFVNSTGITLMETVWDAWRTANTDGGDPAVYIETRDACGEDIIIQVDQEPVLSPALVDDPLDETLIVPDISAYVPGDPDCLRCQPYRRRFCCFYHHGGQPHQICN